jgi:hypothetical protein
VKYGKRQALEKYVRLFERFFHKKNFLKENKSVRAPAKRNTRVTQKRPPCADMSITPESPNKMTTRSQVRSSNTSLNCSIDTEINNKRDRQRKSQTNQRTPGLFIFEIQILLKTGSFCLLRIS